MSAASKRESTRQFLKAGRPQGTSSLKNAAPAANDTAVKVSNDKRICHGQISFLPIAVGLDGGAIDVDALPAFRDRAASFSWAKHWQLSD